MSHNIQITIDCIDPHAQADWWAATLEWAVEPSDESFIRSMIEQGYASDADTMIHNGSLVWKEGAAICPTEQVGVKPRQRILFQPVPEPKTVKDRIHLDINLDGQDKDALRDQFERRGATFLYQANQGPHVWFTMADPEGNEFCFG